MQFLRYFDKVLSDAIETMRLLFEKLNSDATPNYQLIPLEKEQQRSRREQKPLHRP